MVVSSRPLNLIDPETHFPLTPKSCITPKATVDFPHPDSPTSPIASPGITVQEKSITAGISNSLVKNDIERFLISRIGPSYGSFIFIS